MNRGDKSPKGSLVPSDDLKINKYYKLFEVKKQQEKNSTSFENFLNLNEQTDNKSSFTSMGISEICKF
jgi:hypothetical protein